MKLTKISSNKMILFFLIFLSLCKSPAVYRNFEQYKPLEEIATLEFDGYVLHIKENSNQEFYDKLYLLEGKYLIEFKDRRTFIKGAALCNLKANKRYTIKIISKKEFPQHNKIVYIGECIEIPKEEPGFLERYLLDKKLEEESKKN
jgi:hypothetical protein